MLSLRALVLCLLLTALPAAAQSAGSLFKKGRGAEARGDFAGAYLLYSQASALDPQEPRYWAYAQAVRRRAIPGLNLALAPAPATEEDPEESEDHSLDPITGGDLREARQALPPPSLQGAPGLHDFDLTGDARALYEKVTAAFGLMVVFDSDFQPGAPVRFRQTQVDWRGALHALEAVTGTFLVAVNEKVALVARDTPQKRTEIEPHMSVLVPFPEPLTPQEIQEAARAVQSTFDMTKVAIDNSRRQVLFRDRVSRVKPALELFRQLMSHKAQVMVEIEILAADDRSAISYGLRLPTAFPIVNFGRAWNHSPSLPAGFAHYLAFGGGATLFGVGLASAELFASMTQSSTRTITRSQLRGVDSQPLTLHVGDRYPIMTQSYIGDTSGPGQVFTPPPTVQFEELGVVIKVTPRIHNTDEVTLDFEAELKVLAGQALNGIPVISNRRIASRVRMRFDETAVIAGLASSTEIRGSTGLPIFVPLLRAQDRTREQTQLLVTLRPRLVSLPPTETATPALRVGSESRPLTPLD